MSTLNFKQKKYSLTNSKAIWAGVHEWRRMILFVVLFISMLVTVAMSPQRSAVAASTCQTQHLVQRGETLAKIAQRYNVKWTDIATANNLSNPNRIVAGTYLCIPIKNPPTTPPPATCQTTHIVQRGETLYRIGLRYGVSQTIIAQVNNLTNPNRIYAGQRLCIPSNNQPPPTTPPPAGTVPTIKIVSVVANRTVTISATNFPANRQFDVLMGAYGTKGINGTWVSSINSGSSGTFTASFSIPSTYHNANKIAIRLQSSSGHNSYNWFYNNTTR